MEIDAKEFGELIGEIRTLASKVEALSKSVIHLTENYIGRPEYERRHAEMMNEVHRRDAEIETRIESHSKRISANRKEIDHLNVTSAKGGVRDRMLEHIGIALFGGVITFIIIAVTHVMHLL